MSDDIEERPADDDVIRTIATAEHPPSTSQIAEWLDLPRSSTWDILNRLEEGGAVYSWNAHGSTRMWGVPGNWGNISIQEVYSKTPLNHYLETGKFPPDVEWNDIAGMLEEVFVEAMWAMPMDGGFRYDEVDRLADLFGMAAPVFMQHSPSDIYNLLHEGAVGEIPREGHETIGGEVVPERSKEAFRDIRNRNGITQSQVGRLADIQQAVVSHWETGQKDLGETDVEMLWGALERILQNGDAEPASEESAS